MENTTITLDAVKIADHISAIITSALWDVWSDQGWTWETGDQYHMNQLLEIHNTFQRLHIPVEIKWDTDNGLPYGISINGGPVRDVFAEASEMWYKSHPEDRPKPPRKLTPEEEEEADGLMRNFFAPCTDLDEE